MVSSTCVCCCIKEAEGGQSDSQQAGGRQEDGERSTSWVTGLKAKES